MSQEQEKELFENLDEMKASIQRIEICLAGDPRLNTEGLKQRVDRYGKKIDSFEMDRAKAVGAGTAAGAFISGIITFIYWLFNKHQL